MDDLKRFHRQFYGANHARFALVGDFDAKAAQSQLQKLFGGWNSPVTYSRAPSLLPPAKPGQQQLQAKDKANAFYLATAPLAMRDSDADYPAMLVANKILGGGVKSRLLDRLRQKDGISYYAGSQFKAGSFEPVASLSLVAIYAPQNLEKLKQGVTEELTRFIRDGRRQRHRAGRRQEGAATGKGNRPRSGRRTERRAGRPVANRPRHGVQRQGGCRHRRADGGAGQRRAAQTHQPGPTAPGLRRRLQAPLIQPCAGWPQLFCGGWSASIIGGSASPAAASAGWSGNGRPSRPNRRN
ncbi:insulinase family protein [Chromobacterium haemolyticum]|nr:insulinase family protein [Chromobacterium haemolyticum]